MMKILHDIMGTIDGDGEIKKIVAGAHWTAVLSRHCGLSSTFHDPPPHRMVRDAGDLRQKTARELAQYAMSDAQLEASIGMAALNSLIDINTDDCLELNALNVLEEKGRGRAVAVVGHFPFVPKLKKTAKELWVLELNPREGDLSADEAANVLPRADVVCITGSSFINHSVDDLLSFCGKNSFVLMVGATSPMSTVLFDYGVDLIAGASVVDQKGAFECISQGASFRQISGVKRLIMMRERTGQ
jgi:uncharacterized protein (DUF4213/DUF364 family)